MVFFWMIFITLMLPVEVRILPTYKVAADLKMLDSYAGLIFPLIASATATFLFRQFFMTVPDELCEAAPHRRRRPHAVFLRHPAADVPHVHRRAVRDPVHLRMEPVSVAASHHRATRSYYTLFIGIKRMLDVGEGQAEWHIIMAATILAMLPPVLVVILMQKQFVRGMTETEK